MVLVQMGRWYILRHGETEWNAQSRVQGHTDISLSSKGLQQAAMVARRLADVSIDAAYSSDLSRSAETARKILGPRTVPLHTTARLREYNKGVFEGLTPVETGERYPALYAASHIKDLDFAPPGGESTRQTSIRMASFIAELRARHLDDNVLIVGHGGSLRAAFVALMELPLEANWRFAMANCGLSVIDVYSDNAVLRLYNDTSHMDGLGSVIL
jgi:broad specificity phosphatase PhoE